MEFYKIQFRIPKKEILKTKDEELQWQSIRNLITRRKAELTIFEKSDDEFDRPSGLPDFPQWSTKIQTDVLLETTLGFKDSELEEQDNLYKRIASLIDLCNIYEYIYLDDSGIHVSLAYLDTDGFLEEDTQDSKADKPVKKTERQIDMFKNKKKSK